MTVDPWPALVAALTGGESLVQDPQARVARTRELLPEACRGLLLLEALDLVVDERTDDGGKDNRIMKTTLSAVTGAPPC